jgi:hypothetical protein
MFESQVYLHSRIIYRLRHALNVASPPCRWHTLITTTEMTLYIQALSCNSFQHGRQCLAKASWGYRKFLESASIVGSESVTSRSLAWRCSPMEPQRSQAFRMTVRRQHQKNFLILSGAAWHGFKLYSGWDLAELWLENVWLPNANVCNIPGFNLSIHRHWGVADGAVLNKVHKNSLKSPLDLIIISPKPTQRLPHVS